MGGSGSDCCCLLLSTAILASLSARRTPHGQPRTWDGHALIPFFDSHRRRDLWLTVSDCKCGLLFFSFFSLCCCTESVAIVIVWRFPERLPEQNGQTPATLGIPLSLALGKVRHVSIH